MTAGRTPPPTRATVEGRAYLDLRAIAKKSGRTNDEYLRLYALEGFLLRLAASAISQEFVLKGGVLLAAYQLRRPTADIDFAALNTSNDLETIKSMIITVADNRLPDDQNDGLRFDTSDTDVVAIRDDDEYHGVRVTLGAQLSTAKMRFHVDVNVGDPIWVTNAPAGQIAGSVTARNRCQGPAPSTSAASTSSFRTPCKAARKIIMDQPTPFQTPSAEMATIPVHRLDSQEMLLLVRWLTSCSIQLTRPLSANRYWNSRETTTQLVTTGR